MNIGSGSSLTWHKKRRVAGVCTGIDVGFELEAVGLAYMFCNNWSVASDCSQLRADGFVKLLTILAAANICCRLLRRFRLSVLGR